MGFGHSQEGMVLPDPRVAFSLGWCGGLPHRFLGKLLFIITNMVDTIFFLFIYLFIYYFFIFVVDFVIH